MVMRINRTTVGAEVISIDIVYKTVVVVVNTGCAIQFLKIDTHIAGKVFMLVVDTSINDGNHHIAFTGFGLPRFKKIDVGAGNRSSDFAIVLIMPLVG